MSTKSACETSHAHVCGNYQLRATGWAQRYFTVQNGLMLVVALFQVGGLWERQQVSNTTLVSEVVSVRNELQKIRQETETSEKQLRAEREAHFVRKDLLTVQLAAIEGRLQVIEGMVRDELRPYGRIPSKR